MNRARLAASSILVASLCGVAGCASHGRCTELQVDALAVSAELGVQEIGGSASAAAREAYDGYQISRETGVRDSERWSGAPTR